MRRCTRLIAPCLLILLAVNPTSASPTRPFAGYVTATWDNIFLALVAPPAHFNGGGPVTYMGQTSQAGTLTLEPAIATDIYPGFGAVVITGANGDKLNLYYSGLLDAENGIGFGTFVLRGGTGRFAHATGSGILFAQIDLSLPDHQPMTVVLDGKISF
jgi:hypothetical protein